MLALLLFLPLLLAAEDCGISHSTTSSLSRIIGGDVVTDVRKWPWQVSLISVPPPPTPIHWANITSKCTGTIIGRRWVLSAAHCYFVDMTDLAIIASSTIATFDNEEDFKKAEVRRVKTYKPHPAYLPTRNDDMLLLELESPLTYGDGVGPICLPGLRSEVPDNVYAVAIGYGVHEDESPFNGKTIYDGKLRETQVNIIPRDVCSRRMPPLHGPILSTDLCIDTYGHNAHGGDSGGPLMMKSGDGRWFEIGVANSIDSDKLEEHEISIYKSVKDYCRWIRKETKSEVRCRRSVALKGPSVGN